MKTIAQPVNTVNALMQNQRLNAEPNGDLLFAGTDAHRQPVMTIDQETVAQLMVELSEPTSEELFLATALTMLRAENSLDFLYDNDDDLYAEQRENDSIGREECSGVW